MRFNIGLLAVMAIFAGGCSQEPAIGQDGDTLHFTVEGMGQRVAVRLEVADRNVHAVFQLPAFLAMFAEPLRAKLQKDGPKLLE